MKDIIVKITGNTKGLDKATKSTKQGFRDIGKEAKKTSELMQKAGAAVTGFFGAQLIKQTVSGLVSVNMEMFEIGQKAEGIVKAFDNIAGSNLEELREATKGTVDDLTLMQNAVKGSNLGLDITEMGTLFKFAQQRARETGESVDHLVESITVGIGRKSPLILDNLGISAIQLKKAMNGVTLEAGSVADVTRAVGKIAEEAMKNAADMTDNTAASVERLKATWMNAQLEGGQLLTDSTELKEEIDAITKIILDNKAPILQFITEWGVGALKIAGHLGEAAGFWADVFTADTKTPIQAQVDVVSELTDQLREEKKIVEDLKKRYKGDWNATSRKEKQNKLVEALKAEIKHQQMLLTDVIRLSAAEKKLADAKKFKQDEEKKRQDEINKREAKRLELLGKQKELSEAAAKARIAELKSFTADVNTNPLFKQQDQSFGGGMFSPEASRIGGVGLAFQSEINDLGGRMGGDLLSAEDKKTIEDKKIEDQKTQNEEMLKQQAAYYDAQANIINNSQTSIISIHEFFAEQSLQTFASMSTSMISSIQSVAQSISVLQAGKQGSSILGTLGVVGAGISLVAGLASAFSSKSDSTPSLSASSDFAKADIKSKPNQTISKKADTINNFFNNTYEVGNLVGSNGMKELSDIITEEQINSSLAMI
jgi:hypothetical protein